MCRDGCKGQKRKLLIWSKTSWKWPKSFKSVRWVRCQYSPRLPQFRRFKPYYLYLRYCFVFITGWWIWATFKWDYFWQSWIWISPTLYSMTMNSTRPPTVQQRHRLSRLWCMSKCHQAAHAFFRLAFCHLAYCHLGGCSGRSNVNSGKRSSHKLIFQESSELRVQRAIICHLLHVAVQKFCSHQIHSSISCRPV